VNSLRPLATISLLGIVGLFLYMKINETEPVVPADVAEWGNLDELGNLEIGGSGDIADIDIGGAPADTGATAQSTATTAPPYGASADTAASEPPSFASAPSFAPDSSAQAPPAFVRDASEPATTDRYSQAAPSESIAPASETKPNDSKLPPLPALPAAAAGTAAVINELASGNAPAADITANTASTDSAAPAPYVTTPVDTAAPPSFPVTESITPTESLEADKQTTAGQASLFSATRVAVQSALDRGELSQALLLLSDWYGDPSLAPAEATEVQELLSQLAGSVIYSTEHRLEPPHMVQAGEKLEDIAQKHNVPWQLLAKINGISDPSQLQPGQQLKVVRGPFSARIDLSDRKLVLMLDRRYAGQFPLDIEPTTSVEEGYWSVNQKLLTPGSVGMVNPSVGAASEEHSILLTSAGGNGQVTILRGPGGNAAGSGPAERVIKLRGSDVNDVYDILSVGSQVIIRR
jgi:LysM repeat protein